MSLQRDSVGFDCCVAFVDSDLPESTKCSKLTQHNQALDCNHPFNAPFHVVAKILKMITSSAMETEVAATFYNSKEALPFRVTLTEMGHPQPTTPMEVDNEIAIGFLKITMKQKRSKTIDMRF